MAAPAVPQSIILKFVLSLFVIFAIPIFICVRYFSSRSAFRGKTPPTVSDNYPVIGTFAFFTKPGTSFDILFFNL